MMHWYADDAALFHPDGLVVGKDRIRSWMAAAMAPLPAEEFGKYIVTHHETHNDVSYTIFTWNGVSQPGTDTFVVRDGLIVAQTAFFTATVPVQQQGQQK